MCSKNIKKTSYLDELSGEVNRLLFDAMKYVSKDKLRVNQNTGGKFSDIIFGKEIL